MDSDKTMIPPVFLWTLGTAAGAAAIKLAMREARRINDHLEALRQSSAAPKPAPASAPIRRLKRDPKTGTYRPE